MRLVFVLKVALPLTEYIIPLLVPFHRVMCICNKNDNYTNNVKNLQLLLKSYQNRPIWKLQDEQSLIAKLMDLQGQLHTARSDINGKFAEELNKNEVMDCDAKMDKDYQKLVNLITDLIELIDVRTNQIKSKK